MPISLSNTPVTLTTTAAGINTNQLQALYPTSPGTAGVVLSIASSGTALTLSSVANLNVNDAIIFTFKGSFGNISSGTTYYIKTIGTSSITISQTVGGAAFDPGTTLGGSGYLLRYLVS